MSYSKYSHNPFCFKINLEMMSWYFKMESEHTSVPNFANYNKECIHFQTCGNLMWEYIMFIEAGTLLFLPRKLATHSYQTHSLKQSVCRNLSREFNDISRTEWHCIVWIDHLQCQISLHCKTEACLKISNKYEPRKLTSLWKSTKAQHTRKGIKTCVKTNSFEHF